MKKFFNQNNITFLIVSIISILLYLYFKTEDKKMNPPIAKKIPYTYEIHDLKINDEYFWLRDVNWPKVSDNEILSHLTEENKYTDNFFINN